MSGRDANQLAKGGWTMQIGRDTEIIWSRTAPGQRHMLALWRRNPLGGWKRTRKVRMWKRHA